MNLDDRKIEVDKESIIRGFVIDKLHEIKVPTLKLDGLIPARSEKEIEKCKQIQEKEKTRRENTNKTSKRDIIKKNSIEKKKNIKKLVSTAKFQKNSNGKKTINKKSSKSTYKRRK